MKFIKRNQVIIYATALMLIVAGYLNFTTGISDKKSKTASVSAEIKDSNNINNTILNKDYDNKNINNENVSNEDISDENIKNENVNNENTDNSAVQSEIASTDNNIGDAQFVSANAVKEVNAKDENEYFSKSKLDRDTMYSQIIETYEKILNSSNSTETQKQSATEEIQKINNTKNSIMICENLIETKGFENSVIFVNDKNIDVIVKDKELTAQKVAQIQNILSREMKAKVENIHISSK